MKSRLVLLLALAACDPPLEEPLDTELAPLAGDLDPGFGTGGYVTTDADVSAAAYGYAVARQADGKLVVAGEAWNGERYVGVVGRFHPDGSRDASFAGVRIDLLGQEVTLRALALQADGKIIVAGRVNDASGTSSQALLVRLLADGNFDETFASGGIATLAASGNRFAAHAVAVQADGKIVAAGTRTTSTAADALVLRVTASGVLDPSFNGVGYRYVSFNTSEEAAALALQGDGKIVVAGTSAGQHTGGTFSDMFVARLNPGGALDAGFSGDGIALAVINDSETAHAVAVQADGKIVVAGQTLGDVAVARFLPGGNLDTSFSGDGKTSFSANPVVGNDAARGVAITADQKILLAGYGVQASGRTDVLFARLTTAGELDATFDGDGVRLAQFGAGAAATGVVLQPDGKAVAVGNRYDNIDSRIALLRANPSGALDAGFDGDGKATLDLHPHQERSYASAVQADGKLVLVGETSDGFRKLCFVTRYTANGALDPTFSADGKHTFLFTDRPLGCSLRAVAVQGDGRILVLAGDRVGRLTAAGAWDTTFSADGQASIAVAEAGSGSDLALAADGRIWVGGTIRQLGQDRLGLWRLTASGGLDTSFSGDGWTTYSFGGQDQSVARIAPLADGRVVALASTPDAPLVTRFLATGAIEGNFGVGGKVVLDAQSTFGQSASSLLVQPDGGLVALTSVVDGFASGRIVVWKLTAAGAFDPSFDGDGQRVVQPLTASTAGALLRQSDGKLVIAGRGGTPGGEVGCLFVRLLASGAFDPTYSGDGWSVHQPGFACRITDAAFVPGSNTLLATGYESFTAPEPGLTRGDNTPYDFLAMRVQPL